MDQLLRQDRRKRLWLLALCCCCSLLLWVPSAPRSFVSDDGAAPPRATMMDFPPRWFAPAVSEVGNKDIPPPEDPLLRAPPQLLKAWANYDPWEDDDRVAHSFLGHAGWMGMTGNPKMDFAFVGVGFVALVVGLIMRSIPDDNDYDEDRIDRARAKGKPQWRIDIDKAEEKIGKRNVATRKVFGAPNPGTGGLRQQ
eukprot:TRINITY_DN65915_c0_g1_i1.p1 TRINITY_DN65915_c0_g1~~TRINITY_DN65915_c0_g1_i1.p1  ORF type:complete len:196 (+),score=32.68 TRINITY_DN65915_c0_g1_i1:98-685(+)